MARRPRPVPKHKTVEVACHAINPDPKKRGACGQVLGHIPGPVRFVAVSTRRADVLDGRIRLQCARRDCRTWNVFEVGSE